MRESLIRWKINDYKELEKAVNSFNRKIKRLERRGKTSLPETLDFVETRKEIRSRKELNRILKSLEGFKKSGSEEIVKLKSGTEIIKWEYGELKKARRRAKTNLTREAIKILQTRNASIGMGDERLSQIESIIESFENLENKKGFEFQRTKKSIFIQGSIDINLKRAETFRRNFLESVKEASSFENYDKLVKELNKIKNPIDFYNKVKESQIAMDFGVWYNEIDDPNDTISYGKFATSQDMFNEMLNQLDIPLEKL